MTRRYQEALFAEGAGNLSGLAFSLMNWQRQMLFDGASTEDVYRDPAVKLVVYRMAELTGIATNNVNSDDYWETRKQCMRLAGVAQPQEA